MFALLALPQDGETVKFCNEHGVNVFRMNKTISTAQSDTGANHAVSAMKFGILRHFLELGYSVLLSDVDIAILQNPFDHLYRDSDVEGMTDGFDERTAYGGWRDQRPAARLLASRLSLEVGKALFLVFLRRRFTPFCIAGVPWVVVVVLQWVWASTCMQLSENRWVLRAVRCEAIYR